MASTINANNTTGLVSTADTSGILQLQTNGTTAVTVDDSQRVAFVAGTAALPAITTTGDTNTGIFFPAADTIAFSEGGAEAMRLDSSGNLGLGVTPSAYGTNFKAIQIGLAGNVASQTGARTIEITSNAYNNSGWKYQATDKATLYYQYDGGHAWATAASGTAGNAITFTQAMTLDSSGNLFVNTTSQITNEKLSVNTGNTVGVGVKTTGGASNAPIFSWNATTSGDGFFVAFATETSLTVRGSITYNRSAGLTSYNTTSDYRAKDITGPVTGSGALIDSVPVYMGKMKGATQERPMFIAHEVPAYAHTGEKDAVDEDGKPVYQQMDASALIPVMWAEIQSLRQRLSTLKTRLDAANL